VKDVVERYFGLFESFAKHMESLARG